MCSCRSCLTRTRLDHIARARASGACDPATWLPSSLTFETALSLHVSISRTPNLTSISHGNSEAMFGEVVPTSLVSIQVAGKELATTWLRPRLATTACKLLLFPSVPRT